MDHHEKLAWSAQHLHALDLEIRDFLSRHAFGARGQQREGTRQFDIIVNETPRLPSHWPLMAGDAIHNMRSALDHMIWALTDRSKSKPNAQQARRVGFPTCETREAYFGRANQTGTGARSRQAGWIGEAALAVVDGLQPYLRGNDAFQHPLAVIAAYSNEDKHRNLVASAVLATSVQFQIEFGSAATRQLMMTGFDFTPTGAWLYEGAILGLLEFREGTTCEPGEMVVRPVFSGDIAFGMAGRPVFTVAALETVLDAIHRDVVAPLDEILCSPG